MSDRRSARSSKKINYASFEGGGGDDDDFDEDFKSVTPPPTKKVKTSKTSNKENNLKKKAIANQEKSTKKRKAPEDRGFDRELQLALEMSMHESQESDVEAERPNGAGDQVSFQISSEPISITASVEATASLTMESTPVRDLDPPVLQPIKTVIVEDDDDIQVIGSVSDEEPKSKRRSATKPKKPAIDSDSESDFNPDGDDDAVISDESDNDYEEDNDSDFEGFGGTKKKGKEKAKQQTAKKSTTPKQSKTTAKSKAAPVPKAVAPRSKVTAVRNSVSPSVGRTMSSPVGRCLAGGTPKWTPPGSAGIGKSLPGSVSVKSPVSSLGGVRIKSPCSSLGGVSVKSPSSSLGGVSIKSPLSGLRLGLSRNQSVRPLHSGFKVQH